MKFSLPHTGFDGPPGSSDDLTLSREQVLAWAREAGFTEAGLVAFPDPNEARDAERFEQWVKAGRAGTMHYLERVAAVEHGKPEQLLRARVATPFLWARTAIVCFANYESAQPHSTDPAPDGAGWIARYAWSSKAETGTGSASGTRPTDYHKVLLKRIKALESRLREQFGGFEARGYVDTGPVVERSLAVAAGLGWTGKNTCLIHPKLGSFGFLAVLLTSLKAQKDEAHLSVPDRCGSCTRCLQACPTGALIAPYQMDAKLCISYLTIEHRGPIEPDLMAGMGRQVFGCDICQDVCPWNRKAPVSADPELEARAELVNPALEWLAEMDEAEFELRFNGSPVRRTGFEGLRRNVAIAMGNSAQVKFLPWLKKWAETADEGLRKAAGWSIERLKAVS